VRRSDDRVLVLFARGLHREVLLGDDVLRAHLRDLEHPEADVAAELGHEVIPNAPGVPSKFLDLVVGQPNFVLFGSAHRFEAHTGLLEQDGTKRHLTRPSSEGIPGATRVSVPTYQTFWHKEASHTPIERGNTPVDAGFSDDFARVRHSTNCEATHRVPFEYPK